MSFYAIAAAINFFSSLILGIFVLSKRKKATNNRTFALFAFTVAFWSLGYYFWQVSNSAQEALWWCRFLMAGAIFIPATYLHFVYAFLGLLKRKRKFLIASYLLLSVFLVLNFTSFFVNRVESIHGFSFWPFPGPAYHVFLALWVAYVVYTTYLLYSRYRKAQEPMRHQIAYILVGMVIGFAGGATNYFLWYGIPIYPFANILVSVYVGSIAYAIVKHNLMHIKAVAAEVFSGLLLVINFVAILRSQSPTELAVNILLFAVTAVFVVMVVRSIFAEIRQREQLKAANAELAKLDKTKTEFLSIASHQLRAPLTVINGYISMILDGSMGPVSKKIKDCLDKVYISGGQLVNLIETLLDITRIEAGRIEFDLKPINLLEIVQGLVADFQKRAKEKGIRLTFRPATNLPQVSADPAKVKEVISNLLDNAVKYTNKGSVTVVLTQEGQKLIFSCQDTGPGISPEDLARLFKKFVRGTGETAKTKGTGLGLYYARMVIENMKGKIWVESKGVGKGSTFFFSLPVAPRGVMNESSIPTTTSSKIQKGKAIGA